MSTNASPPTTRLRNHFLTSVVGLFLLGCSPVTLPVDVPFAAGAQLAETGRVYALVETPAAARSLQDAARQLGYAPLASIDLDGLDLTMVPVDLPAGVTGLEAINALENAVPSSTVGVNHAYRLQQLVEHTRDRRTYANELMGWPEGGCPARTAIGLIDGGLDMTMPSLAGVSIQTQDFAQGSPSSRRHGTDVASVLIDPSRISGASLFSANVINARDNGEDIAGAAALVQAIDWLASQNVTLINVSLAGPTNKLLAQAVSAAQNRGVMFVAAVGNAGPSAPAQFPAAFDDVIAVTALDANKRIFRNAVRGPHVDFAAPGVDIFVQSQTGGRFVSGTSMAAPFVTSYLATKTRDTTSISMSAMDLGTTGKDDVFGNGLVQATDGC